LSFVLDTSVALAWCFVDEQTPAVMALLDRVTEAGAAAPQLWVLEVLNGLFVAERRRRLDTAQRKTFAGFLRGLPVVIDNDAGERAWDAIADLAERFKLTTYAACYLELALRRRMPLATLDRALRDAASSVRIEVWGIAS
jgi:predicted nucleic acid-binding protein